MIIISVSTFFFIVWVIMLALIAYGLLENIKQARANAQLTQYYGRIISWLLGLGLLAGIVISTYGSSPTTSLFSSIKGFLTHFVFWTVTPFLLKLTHSFFKRKRTSCAESSDHAITCFGPGMSGNDSKCNCDEHHQHRRGDQRNKQSAKLRPDQPSSSREPPPPVKKHYSSYSQRGLETSLNNCLPSNVVYQAQKNGEEGDLRAPSSANDVSARISFRVTPEVGIG